MENLEDSKEMESDEKKERKEKMRSKGHVATFHYMSQDVEFWIS